MFFQKAVIKTATIAYPVAVHVKSHPGHDHHGFFPGDLFSVFLWLRDPEVAGFQLTEIGQSVKYHILSENLWHCHFLTVFPGLFDNIACDHFMVIICVCHDPFCIPVFRKLCQGLCDPETVFPDPGIGMFFSGFEDLFSNFLFFFHIFLQDW